MLPEATLLMTMEAIKRQREDSGLTMAAKDDGSGARNPLSSSRIQLV